MEPPEQVSEIALLDISCCIWERKKPAMSFMAGFSNVALGTFRIIWPWELLA